MSRSVLHSVIVSVIVIVSLSSCLGNADNPNKELSIDDFSGISNPRYRFSERSVRDALSRLIERDGVSMAVDRHIRKHYASGGAFIWINRLGVKERADTLLAALRGAGMYGISLRFLRVGQIEADLERMHDLEFAGGDNDVSHVMARLEYNLTLAYSRYSSIMRFGMVNPDYLYNNFEPIEGDTLKERFRQLSDLKAERPGAAFFRHIVGKAMNDSISGLFSAIKPHGELYDKLLAMLRRNGMSHEDSMKILCNIERCRWRPKKAGVHGRPDKYVEVNIPSYSLRAVDNGKETYMRTVCGTVEHKTPLLAGMITRMDVNPQWIVPKSIAKGYVGRHDYMHRMGMFVLDKEHGKLPPEAASYDRVMAGEQYVVQAGGSKNALGRIIFRFDNGFSVFLHDTSSPWLFSRPMRALSHGCVRVEKPYELALFMLDEKDVELEDKLKYSMTVELVNDNDSLKKNDIDRKRLVRTLYVRPAVPLFITYYTIYYDNSGRIACYDDVYGYDAALAEQLKPFVE